MRSCATALVVALGLVGCGSTPQPTAGDADVAGAKFAAQQPAAKSPENRLAVPQVEGTAAPAKSPSNAGAAKPADGRELETIRVKFTGDPREDAYLLSVYSDEELVRIERSEPVFLALLSRNGLDHKWRTEAIACLAKLRDSSPLAEIVAGIAYVDENGQEDDATALNQLAEMLLAHDAATLSTHRQTLAEFVERASQTRAKQIALAAMIVADDRTNKAWQFAEENGYRAELFGGLPLVPSGSLRATLFEQAQTQLEQAFEDQLRAACLTALASMEGREADAFELLAEKVADSRAHSAAVAALLSVAKKDAWPKDQLAPLGSVLVDAIREMPKEDRNSPPGKAAVALARAVAERVADDDRKRLSRALANLVVPTIELATVHDQMVYDRKVLVAQAGKPLHVVLKNNDALPHNIVFLKVSGSSAGAARVTMEKVALAAEMLFRMASGKDPQFVPLLDDVVASSEMIFSGEEDSFTFTVPDKPGIYPFICTFPGQWTKMFGALVVVEDVDAYLAGHPTLPTAEKLLGLRERVKDYSPAEVQALLAPVNSGRSFEHGKHLFESAAGCISCHRMQGKGGLIGPELTELKKRYQPHEIVREIVEPNKVITKDYATVRIVIDGKTYQGLIVEETANAWKLKPIEKLLVECEPTVIKKGDFIKGEDTFTKLASSMMPGDLLNILHEDEIIDLYAYVLSGGDPNHAVFQN